MPIDATRRSKRSLQTSLVVLSLACTTSSCVTKPMTRNGTMYFFAAADNGLVVCADRRVRDDGGREIETLTKIQIVDGRAAFVVAGKLSLDKVDMFGRGRRLYDVNDLTAKYLSTRDASAIEWDHYAAFLSSALTSAFAEIPLLDRPTNQTASLIQVNVAWHDGQEPRLATTSVDYTDALQLRLSVRSTVDVRGTYRHATISAGGNFAIWNEIMRGKDPRFDDLRTNATVRKLLTRSGPSSDVKVADVVRMAERVFPAASELTYEVGPTFDCAAILSDRTVQWLTQRR